MRSIEDTQRLYIRKELYQARDIIPLLMKRRNGEKWSAEERAKLLQDLRAMSHLSPYLIPLLMPGGVLLLPLIAWWMERRHKKRKSAKESLSRFSPQQDQSTCGRAAKD